MCFLLFSGIGGPSYPREAGAPKSAPDSPYSPRALHRSPHWPSNYDSGRAGSFPLEAELKNVETFVDPKAVRRASSSGRNAVGEYYLPGIGPTYLDPEFAKKIAKEMPSIERNMAYYICDLLGGR